MDIKWESILESAIDKNEIEKALASGPIPIMAAGGQFTVPSLLTVITNPIYTGIGPYPKFIEDTTWIKANKMQVERIGASLVLRVMLDSLRQSFQ